jgi:hypothetical protein
MNRNGGLLLPHTQISSITRIRVERVLPAPGEILVRTGERVRASQKIARYPARGEVRVVNVANILGLENPDMARVMVKKPGDRVEAGEILAARRGVLPFWHKSCRSPVAGRLAAIGHGWGVIEVETSSNQEKSIDGSQAQPGMVDWLAFIGGQVTAVADHRSVTIETFGTYIVAACGVGGEGCGVLQVPAKDPVHALAASDIGPGLNNAVLVGGASVLPEAIDRAAEMKVRAIIVGGISPSFHEPGLAPPFPIVATEGYGNLPMSAPVIDALRRWEGREVSVSGQMGGAWDNSRPAIILPQNEQQEEVGNLPTANAPMERAGVGGRVRAVRSPFLGQVGEIVSLVAEPQIVPSGLSLPGARVAFADSVQFVPWLNLEQLS